MWGRGTPHFQLENAVQTKPCGLAHDDAEATPESTLAQALLTSCVKHPHPDAELLIHSLTWS
jgi:hypothetical protein